MSPELVTIALLIWSVGASLYTVQLWQARGVTDSGALSLSVMLVGSVVLMVALRDAAPALAICVLLPGAFAAVILGVKVRSRLRTRWHRPPKAWPAMLSRVPPKWPEVAADADPRSVPMARWWPAEVAQARDPVPSEVPDGLALDEALAENARLHADLHAELDRAQRMAKLYG